MAKDIKTKTVINDIKTRDSKNDLKHYMKSNSNPEVDKKQKDDKSIPTNQAVSKVEQTAKATSVESFRRSKNYVKSKAKERKDKKKKTSISSDELSQKEIKTKDKEVSNSKNKSEDNSKHSSNKSTKIKEKKLSNESSKKIKSYRDRMKSFALIKHKNKVKDVSQKSRTIKHGAKSVFHGIQTTFKFITVSVRTMSNLISYGTALILLIVISLFFGVFGALSDDEVLATTTKPLSQEVIAYTDTIRKYAKQYEIEEYVPLIQAVMMQESAGKGNDPMQSSECEYNTEYPKKLNGITDPEYSINVGIHYLSDCLKESKVKEPYDIKNIYLALQAYNYGKGYITWAVEYFGGYTRANAKVYSDEKKAELNVTTYGDPHYVSNVLRYYKLGSNGKIVEVALSQLGNVGGKPYWSWWGYSSRVEWCAIFVSWCADQSNLIQEGVIPRFENCVTGANWFKEKDKWLVKGSIPNTNDIIFFDWENDGISDHVGIVEKVENNTVYTIEGNSNDRCRQNRYEINSKVIYGYGKKQK